MAAHVCACCRCFLIRLACRADRLLLFLSCLFSHHPFLLGLLDRVFFPILLLSLLSQPRSDLPALHKPLPSTRIMLAVAFSLRFLTICVFVCSALLDRSELPCLPCLRLPPVFFCIVFSLLSRSPASASDLRLVLLSSVLHRLPPEAQMSDDPASHSQDSVLCVRGLADRMENVDLA